MRPEIINGLFSLGAAFIAFAGVGVTAYVSVRKLKKESYNKRVTEERIRWLNTMRSLYGTIIAGWKMKTAGDNNSQGCKIQKEYYDEKMYEAEKAKAEFISRLNTTTSYGNQYNPFIKSVLEQMDFIKKVDSEKFDELNSAVGKMNKVVNMMLEQEWHKSKEEI